ncbi:translation initiation factor IF-3 [Clostridium malenominatum]
MINNNNNLNENIRAKEVRLIGEDGDVILGIGEALKRAQDQELDLVMISENANPPVCRIMNYEKYLYEKNKKMKEAKKNQKVVSIKEVKLSATIEEHDIDIKANNAKRFLEKENKVKVSIRFRGRQNNYTSVGNEVFNLFLSKVGDVGVVEKPAKLEGNNMIMILAPKKQ